MGTGAYADTQNRGDTQNSGPGNACEQAGIAAEQAAGLPSGLLLAIGQVESGRWDAARGRVTARPWTINAAGKGQWFDTKDSAIETVRGLSEAGTRSIDVGCFQINLLYHPAAFASLEQAFDPDANARYAARFLLSLFGRTGTWEAATEAYHSADPVSGFTYRRQVFSAWSAAPPQPTTVAASGGTAPARASAPRPKPAAIPALIAGVQVWTPMPAGNGAFVVAMPVPASQPTAASDAPRETLTAAPILPLPVVSYRIMPRR